MKADRPVRHPLRGQHTPEHGFNKAEAAPAAEDGGPKPDIAEDSFQPEAMEGEGLKLLLKQFQELREYVSYYAVAKTDSVKHIARNTVRGVGLAALGFVAVAALIVMGCWFVLSGIAQGAGALWGDRAWIGVLLTGVLALAGVGIGVSLAVWRRRNASRKRTVEKYESRHSRQRDRFGRDVHA